MARNVGVPRTRRKKSQRDKVTGRPSIAAARRRKPDGNTGRAHGGKPKPRVKFTVDGTP